MTHISNLILQLPCPNYTRFGLLVIIRDKPNQRILGKDHEFPRDIGSNVLNNDFRYSQNQESDYIFFVSGLAQFTNANVLNELISYNKEFIIPIMTRYGKLWSNFWGSIGNGLFIF